MIYSPKFKVGFLHCMKCGGTSIKVYLERQDDSFHRPHGRVVLRNYHEPLSRKIQVPTFNLEENKIITLIRNPYDLLPSFWRFWRRLHNLNNEHRRRNRQSFAANDREFGEFVEWFRDEMKHKNGGSALSFWDYFNIDGKIPDNLTIVKMEDMDQFPVKLKELGVPIDDSITIPVVNKTPKDKYQNWKHTNKTKELIREMFKWTFDQGFYDE